MEIPKTYGKQVCLGLEGKSKGAFKDLSSLSEMNNSHTACSWELRCMYVEVWRQEASTSPKCPSLTRRWRPAAPEVLSLDLIIVPYTHTFPHSTHDWEQLLNVHSSAIELSSVNCERPVSGLISPEAFSRVMFVSWTTSNPCQQECTMGNYRIFKHDMSLWTLLLIFLSTKFSRTQNYFSSYLIALPHHRTITSFILKYSSRWCVLWKHKQNIVLKNISSSYM